jgi:uncharacterized protein (TIGR02302 family)
MTRLLQVTEFRTGFARRIGRRVAFARAILAWERFWPALWPATGIAGLAIAAALFDAFTPLPWPVHALLLGSFVTAIALALYLNLAGFAWPRWEDGARRLERDSDLLHRPISEAGDELAAGRGDPDAEELWRAHLIARLATLGRIRLRRPRSDLAQRDPHALRFVVLVLIILGALLAGPDIARRFEAALGPDAGTTATLDAWIDPPAYTGEPPIYLARSDRLAVPQGSILHLRVHGADHLPSVSLHGIRFEGGEGEYAASGPVNTDGHVRVRAGGRTIGSWKIAVIPDLPPTIAFAAPPTATDRQALRLSYKASDDYGVVAARAIIRPHGGKGAPLLLDLQLPEASAKSVSQTIFRDLTENPYAGLKVDITLETADAIGQTGASNTVVFTLPQRVFTDPLARALVEQRQILASTGGMARGRVLRTLDALTIAPEQFYARQTGVYLALRAAYWGLKYANSKEDFERVQDLLWQTALGLERGGLLNMAEQLRRMQRALMQLLAQGGPQDEIDALLKRYNDLMQQYLQALAQNAPQNGGQPSANTKVLGADDLTALLKAIQALAQSGDRLKAMQLLAMLQDMMENVQVVGGAGSGSSANDQALRGLGELMGKQRMLLDKTFRQSQGTGDPKDGGATGLSRQQGQLRGDLGDILKQFGGKKSTAQNSLEDAGKLMNQAQEALGMSDFPRATTLQKNALEAMRKGADALAGNMAGRGQQGQGQDPFGRAAGNGRAGPGGNVHIPDASVLQRARDILLELRKRAGQQGRPKEELDYIDRLLKQF